MFVLQNFEKSFFSEINFKSEIIVVENIYKSLIFKDFETAFKFQKVLKEVFFLEFEISNFLETEK